MMPIGDPLWGANRNKAAFDKKAGVARGLVLLLLVALIARLLPARLFDA
ncbi:hypothetical protein [Sphingobium sp. CAP-1]|nr:hypothetical protein [Sphingobium sp. CAP-1]QGP81166.1 hypothetical protein GL174_19180 [Sphingobium sp. CAP-1]